MHVPCSRLARLVAASALSLSIAALGACGKNSPFEPDPVTPTPTPTPPPGPCEVICWACSGQWAAVALSPSTHYCGWSADYSTLAGAKQRAVNECTKISSGAADCQSVVWVQNGCAAVAVNRVAYGWGWAGSQSTAEATAISQCQAHTP